MEDSDTHSFISLQVIISYLFLCSSSNIPFGLDLGLWGQGEKAISYFFAWDTGRQGCHLGM
jgi:hypothetical protein